MAAPHEALVFWQHTNAQEIPDDLWTPVAWNLDRNSKPDREGWTRPAYAVATTAIAVGSDAAVLPEATINVDSTEDFADSGYLAITTAAGVDTVTKYTGKTATTFTGGTLGSGTLATGDVVTQANVEFRTPYPAVAALVAEVAWVNDATATGLRGIRLAFGGGIAGGTNVVPAAVAADPLMHIQTAEQPAFGPNVANNFIEVYQSSGGALNIRGAANLDAPRLVIVTVSSYTAS